MKLSDIIALAKAGYKPADIKELLTIDEPKQAKRNPMKLKIRSQNLWTMKIIRIKRSNHYATSCF